MSTSISSSTSTVLFQEVLGFYSRRMLLHSPPLHHSADQPTATLPTSGINDHDPSSHSNLGDNSFDANVIMILSFLICAVICSLGLNLIIKCTFRCSTVFSQESVTNDNTSPAVTLANTGIKKEALRTFPTFKYSDDLNLTGLGTECVICLSEFAAGEKVRVLPKCNHGFHVWCINRWLKSHSSCPTCRHCLIETCLKIVGGGCNQQNTPVEPTPHGPQQEQIIVSIAPPQPDGVPLSHQT